MTFSFSVADQHVLSASRTSTRAERVSGAAGIVDALVSDFYPAFVVSRTMIQWLYARGAAITKPADRCRKTTPPRPRQRRW
jgi:hypothetical protein